MRDARNIAAMKLRQALPSDAVRLAAIYAPIVAATAVSFEELPPDAAEMERRIAASAPRYPWLVAESDGAVSGYAYASAHRSRAAYRWSVDVSAYVAETARGTGVGTALYRALLRVLVAQGYARAFAGIALPNDPSLALHRAVGFEPLAVYRAVGFKSGAWRDVAWWERELAPRSDPPAEPLTLAAVDVAAALAGP